MDGVVAAASVYTALAVVLVTAVLWLYMLANSDFAPITAKNVSLTGWSVLAGAVWLASLALSVGVFDTSALLPCPYLLVVGSYVLGFTSFNGLILYRYYQLYRFWKVSLRPKISAGVFVAVLMLPSAGFAAEALLRDRVVDHANGSCGYRAGVPAVALLVLTGLVHGSLYLLATVRLRDLEQVKDYRQMRGVGLLSLLAGLSPAVLALTDTQDPAVAREAAAVYPPVTVGLAALTVFVYFVWRNGRTIWQTMTNRRDFLSFFETTWRWDTLGGIRPETHTNDLAANRRIAERIARTGSAVVAGEDGPDTAASDALVANAVDAETKDKYNMDAKTRVFDTDRAIEYHGRLPDRSHRTGKVHETQVRRHSRQDDLRAARPLYTGPVDEGNLPVRRLSSERTIEQDRRAGEADLAATAALLASIHTEESETPRPSGRPVAAAAAPKVVSAADAELAANEAKVEAARVKTASQHSSKVPAFTGKRSSFDYTPTLAREPSNRFEPKTFAELEAAEMYLAKDGHYYNQDNTKRFFYANDGQYYRDPDFPPVLTDDF